MNLALSLLLVGSATHSPLPIPSSALQSADSVALHNEARRAQESFEVFRESRLIPERPRGGTGGGGRCHEVVGRFCLTYGDSSEEAPAAPSGSEEPPEVDLARVELLRTLARIQGEIPGDGWVLGQRVRYLVERGAAREAEAVARNCDLPEPWWCHALTGLARHEGRDWIGAEAAFEEVVATLPDRHQPRWSDLGPLLDRDARRWYGDLSPTDRDEARELIRLLADPLYLVDGNDRWTAHFSRLTWIHLLEDAANPFSLPWGLDLEELILRYGWAVGWTRTRAPGMPQGLQDSRQMTGHLESARRDFVPPGAALNAFPDVQDGEWWIHEGRPRTGHRAGYAPRFEMLDSQTARFRRGEELLVVVGWAIPEDAPPPARVAAAPGIPADDDPFRSRFAEPEPPVVEEVGEAPHDLEGGLFLLPLTARTSSHRPIRPFRELEGVTSATVPNRGQVVSVEAWSRSEGRGWRARHGMAPLGSVSGSLQLSDPILLRDEGTLPESLQESMALVRSSVRVRPGDPFLVAWEVYGVEEGRPASVSMGFEQAERSFLRRLGQFFRVIEPPSPIVLRWEEGDPEEPGTIFRAIRVQLPPLDPGSYDIFLEVGVAGEEPAVARRRIRVEPGE